MRTVCATDLHIIFNLFEKYIPIFSLDITDARASSSKGRGCYDIICARRVVICISCLLQCTVESFYEDALKKRIISMQLGFDEEKSTIPSQERIQALSDKQSKNKLSLATLSTSKYDLKDGIESANITFSSSDPSQERLQQLARPMDRHCWKVPHF